MDSPLKESEATSPSGQLAPRVEKLVFSSDQSLARPTPSPS